MDPVTILSLISGAGSVGKLIFQSGESLYKFIERTRDVDQSVRALHRETAGLGQTITAIRDALQQPTIKNHQAITQDYSLVWKTLDTSMQDCEDTAKTMKLKFQPAQQVRTSFLSQAWRQYKLSVREDEIKDLRSQIHTHGSRLQLSLQMIIVISSIISPDRVIESINPRLDHLIAMVQSQPLPQTQNNGDEIGAQLSQRLNQEFQNAAEVVVTSASTIIGDSRSTVSGLSLYAGRTGSELGTPLNAVQKDRIRGWIPLPDTIEEDALSTSSKSRSSTNLFSPTIGSVLSSATGSDSTIEPISSVQRSSSTIGNLELETIQRLRARGLNALKSGDFIDSKSFLEQTIARMKKLPSKKQKLDQINHCEILLAYALQEIKIDPPHWYSANLSFSNRDLGKSDHSDNYQDVLSACEKLLVGALASPYTTETYRFIATYALCRVFCRQSRLNEAYKLCHETVSALRVQGVNALFQSKDKKDALPPFLGLLSVICRLRNDNGEAAVYDDIRKELGGQAAVNSNTGKQRNYSPPRGITSLHQSQAVAFDSLTAAIQRQKQAMKELDPKYIA